MYTINGKYIKTNIENFNNNIIEHSDSSAATITETTIVSDGEDSSIAYVGDTVILSIKTNVEINTPTVSFKSGGVLIKNTASVTGDDTGKIFVARYVVDEDDTDGSVDITIDAVDNYGNTINGYTTISTGSVTINTNSFPSPVTKSFSDIKNEINTGLTDKMYEINVLNTEMLNIKSNKLTLENEISSIQGQISSKENEINNKEIELSTFTSGDSNYTIIENSIMTLRLEILNLNTDLVNKYRTLNDYNNILSDEDEMNFLKEKIQQLINSSST